MEKISIVLDFEISLDSALLVIIDSRKYFFPFLSLSSVKGWSYKIKFSNLPWFFVGTSFLILSKTISKLAMSLVNSKEVLSALNSMYQEMMLNITIIRRKKKNPKTKNISVLTSTLVFNAKMMKLLKKRKINSMIIVSTTKIRYL